MANLRFSKPFSALCFAALTLSAALGSAQTAPPQAPPPFVPPQAAPPVPPQTAPNAGVPQQPPAGVPPQSFPFPGAQTNPTVQPGMPGGFIPGQVPPQTFPGAVPPAANAPSPGMFPTSGPPPAGMIAPGARPQQPGQKQPMDGATYAVRLRELEQRIDELKEQIRRSHTRLSMLSDTIIAGSGGGSRAVVKFTNELSNIFRVTRVLVVLDGAVQYNKSDQSGALSEQTEIPIFNGSVPPGDHTLQVLVNIQGHGFGAFSYMRAYHFEVRSTHSFTAAEGKTIKLQATAFEKGTATSKLEERPAIRYAEKTEAGLSDPNAAAPAPPR